MIKKVFLSVVFLSLILGTTAFASTPEIKTVNITQETLTSETKFPNIFTESEIEDLVENACKKSFKELVSKDISHSGKTIKIRFLINEEDGDVLENIGQQVYSYFKNSEGFCDYVTNFEIVLRHKDNYGRYLKELMYSYTYNPSTLEVLDWDVINMNNILAKANYIWSEKSGGTETGIESILHKDDALKTKVLDILKSYFSKKISTSATEEDVKTAEIVENSTESETANIEESTIESTEESTILSDKKTALVSIESAKIREFDTADAKVLTSVKKGEELIILDTEISEDGSVWFKVKVKDKNIEGYISSELVEIKETEKEKETEEESTEEVTENTKNEKTIKVIVKSANVRENASSDAKKVTSVKKDSELPVLSEETSEDGDTWYKIKVNDKECFINSDLVEIKK